METRNCALRTHLTVEDAWLFKVLALQYFRNFNKMYQIFYELSTNCYAFYLMFVCHRLFFCKIPIKQPMILAIVFKGDNKQQLSVNLKFTQLKSSHPTFVVPWCLFEFCKIYSLCIILGFIFFRYISCPLTPETKQFNSTVTDVSHCAFTISSMNYDSRCDQMVGNLFRSMASSSSWETR